MKTFPIFSAAVAASALLVSSCSTTLAADGSRTTTLDGQQLARTLQILADK